MQDQALRDYDSTDDEDEPFFQDIDLLQNQGINVVDIKNLKAAGICTIKGILMITNRKLANIKGLNDAKVDKIKEAVSKITVDAGFLTAFELAERREAVFKIATGSEELNKLLGGGVESMAITEVFGEFRTGKTQLAYTLCITCQLPHHRFSGGKAFYIDTESTFRPQRLKQIAIRFNMDVATALKNVMVFRAYTSEEQCEVLNKIAQIFHEEGGAYKLIVVDSIMAHFRVDYIGRAELADRQQKLAQFLARLQRLSEEYNVAVFGTNQMTADPGATMSFQADLKKPIGGHVLAHASTVRIYLRKGRGETRVAKIYDSPDLPEAEATFAITEGGIADTKD